MYGFSADYHTRHTKFNVYLRPKQLFANFQSLTGSESSLHDQYMVLISRYFALAEKMGIARNKTKGLISVGADSI